MEHYSFLTCVLFMFLVYPNDAIATKIMIPRLSPIAPWETTFGGPTTSNDDVETFYYKQLLDHFNCRPESYNTFQQRFMVNSKYWGGSNSSAPILAYLGGEAAIDDVPKVVGFMTANAASFKALLVYIEHRYYGKSIPFRSREEAFKNASTWGYFNSAQTIADYAAIILHIKKTFQTENSPVIVIGGSYAGMLAAWFRLKYPHLAIGALASSAPILYFDNITPQNAYFDVVTRDFREVSETCYNDILNSWSEIDRVASQPKGLSILSQRFNTCYPLTQSSELQDYLRLMYANAAQYDYPQSNPVIRICKGIDGASFGSDIPSKIYGGVVAFKGNNTCNVNGPNNQTAESLAGWARQMCSEMVMPIGIGNSSMFPPYPFDLQKFAKACQEHYGVLPRPHWITTYYGGHNINLVLRKFGSNIIFSNGLRDPYSSGGVLINLSNSLIAVHTAKGSHCLDILAANPSDPEWLVKQRKKEVKIIQRWITQYYADLSAPNGAPKL